MRRLLKGKLFGRTSFTSPCDVDIVFCLCTIKMPCGCKKGSGMSIRGGGVRRRRRKRRRGGGLIGASSSTWTPKYLSAKRGSGWASSLGRAVGSRKRGSGYHFPNMNARFKAWQGANRMARAFSLPRGSGMSIRGGGMRLSGGGIHGLRGKRVLPRRGRGKRLI